MSLVNCPKCGGEKRLEGKNTWETCELCTGHGVIKSIHSNHVVHEDGKNVFFDESKASKGVWEVISMDMAIMQSKLKDSQH